MPDLVLVPVTVALNVHRLRPRPRPVMPTVHTSAGDGLGG